MNCYLVEGAVILKYHVTNNSICEKLTNLVMADSEEEAEYKFIKYYEVALSNESESYRVDWPVVKPTIV
ncbi:hypothetical protein BNNNBJKE_00056 [Aeromonas phage vB_AdhM_DL]|nr:hypothetical protein BNCALIDO_00112 [Aeromonas phage vB_AdhM_TS9]WBF79640.1 hypothetical protein BNNNBJKE_00056 [Aeromonas phage vB_AdhM_DL]